MRAKGVMRAGELPRRVGRGAHPRQPPAGGLTAPNRYPEIFAAAAAAVPDARRILSFGWSTEEGCVSLASISRSQRSSAPRYALNLVKAWKKRSDRIRFVYSSDCTLTRLAPFDVVFCMAMPRAPKKQRRLGVIPSRFSRSRAISSRASPARGLLRNPIRCIASVTRRTAVPAHPSQSPHNTTKALLPTASPKSGDGCLWRKREP